MHQIGRPLLLSGAYRSGSTYAALLLNNHPNLSLGLHTTGAPRYWHKSPNPTEFADRVWHHTYDRFGEEYVPPLSELRAMSSKSGIWLRMLTKYSRVRGGAGMVGEKTNLTTDFFGTFLDEFLNGRTIAVVRDPRSVCVSFREYDHHPSPTYLQSAFVCLKTMQNVIRYSQRFGLDEFRMIIYESLAKRPALVTHDVLQWLGLDWPGSHVMLDQSSWPDVPGSKWSDRSSFSDANSIDVDDAINRWHGRITDRELRFVETICGSVLDYFGYERQTDYDMNQNELLGIAYGDSKLQRMLDRWLRTGEGTEEFPEDPTDKSTWRDVVIGKVGKHD